MEKNLATSLGRVNAISVRAVAMALERDAMTTKYKYLRSCVERHMAFANKEMARLEKEIVKVMQEQIARVTKSELLRFVF